eukprot:scaffold10230_cov22-Tisochrysis_lutea.AAC.1
MLGETSWPPRSFHFPAHQPPNPHKTLIHTDSKVSVHTCPPAACWGTPAGPCAASTAAPTHRWGWRWGWSPPAGQSHPASHSGCAAGPPYPSP